MTHDKSAVKIARHHPYFQFSQSVSSTQPFFSFRDFTCRKEAIDEGYLIDVSALSRTFNASIAVTREVWELYVSVYDADRFREQIRAVSLLSQVRIAIKQAPAHTTEVFFEVKRYPRKIDSFLNKLRLWVVASSGDSNEPVLTVMLDTQHGNH